MTKPTQTELTRLAREESQQVAEDEKLQDCTEASAEDRAAFRSIFEDIFRRYPERKKVPS